MNLSILFKMKKKKHCGSECGESIKDKENLKIPKPTTATIIIRQST